MNIFEEKSPGRVLQQRPGAEMGPRLVTIKLAAAYLEIGSLQERCFRSGNPNQGSIKSSTPVTIMVEANQ